MGRVWKNYFFKLTLYQLEKLYDNKLPRKNFHRHKITNILVQQITSE